MFHYQARKQRLSWILEIFLFYFTLVSSHEAVLSNYQNTPDASTLKIEAKESKASITLGKELILGSPLSTKASIIIESNDIISTKIAPFVSPTIASRISSGEQFAVSQRSVSKNSDPHSSYVNSHKSWVSKSPKITWKRDSYLQALMHSRNSDDPREGIVQSDSKKANRRQYVQKPIYKPETEYDSSESIYTSKNPRITHGGSNTLSSSDSYPQSFKPSMDYNHYSIPQNSYNPPQNSYGSSSDISSYYPQTSSYGLFGNYLSQQGYGPSIHTSIPTPIHGAPYALSDVTHVSLLPNIDLGLPLALKLNAFTIAKIILKLVIFKMIVKFIAVICLLLFIPKLEIIKKKVSDKDDDDERNFLSPYATVETLNNLEDIVKSSVEKYDTQNNARSNSTEKCTTLVCRIIEALTFHDYWHNYLNLFNNYIMEERQRAMRN